MSALLLSEFPQTVATETEQAVAPPSRARRTIIFFLLTLALAAADLIRLGSHYSPLTKQTIYIRYSAVFAALAALCLLGRSARAGRMSLAHIAWIAFGATVTLSACVAGEAEGIATGFWMMIVVPVFFGQTLPAMMGQRSLPLLAVALTASALPYVFYSVWNFPIKVPYMGVTGNPNSLGVIAASAATGLIAVVAATVNRKMPVLRLTAMFAIVLLTALVIASGSRTSLFAVSAVVIMAMFASYPALMRRPERLLGFFLAGAIGATGAFIITGGTTPDSVLSIIAKFENPRASALNHRDDIWAAVWDGRTVLGHGRDYFENEVGVSAHNSAIQMLGEYGLFAALGVIVIAILSLIATFRYYWRNRWEDEYALTPALITVCFWIMACGEGMMAPIGGAVNLSFLIVIGLVSLAPTPSLESSEI